MYVLSSIPRSLRTDCSQQWDVYGIPRSNEPSVADFVTWSNVIVAFFFFAAFGFGGESSAALKKLLRVCRLDGAWGSRQGSKTTNLT